MFIWPMDNMSWDNIDISFGEHGTKCSVIYVELATNSTNLEGLLVDSSPAARWGHGLCLLQPDASFEVVTVGSASLSAVDILTFVFL